MRKTDTHDVMMSAVAVAVDGLTVFGSVMLATWIRFDSGWLPPSARGTPLSLYTHYAAVAAVESSRQGWTMRDRDESRPDGLINARRRIGPGDGAADDDVSGHGMPEIPGAGDGFSAAP